MIQNPEERDREQRDQEARDREQREREMRDQEARDRERIDREMREREERDREMRDRDRREEELRSRERRERERFQERERERQRERQRDRERLRDYEPERARERERDTPRAYWEPFQFKDDFGRVTYASARAGADIFSGMAQVLGSLLGNLKDSFLPGRYGRRGDEERDLDDRERGYGRRRRSSAGRTYDARADVRSAARDAADVLAGAAGDFADYYDRTLYDDREERRERPAERSRRRSSEG